MVGEKKRPRVSFTIKSGSKTGNRVQDYPPLAAMWDGQYGPYLTLDKTIDSVTVLDSGLDIKYKDGRRIKTSSPFINGKEWVTPQEIRETFNTEDFQTRNDPFVGKDPDR